MPPRVQPRIPLQDRIDTDAHPGPRAIPTKVQPEAQPEGLHVLSKVALVLLGVFVACLPLSGLCALLWGPWASLPLLGLAASSLTASILLGAS